MSTWTRGGLRRSSHRSAPAEGGPPKEPPKPGVTPSPPGWLHTVWLVGLVLTLLWLLMPASGPKTTPYTYTAWRAKVVAEQVKTAEIDPDGNVSGTLTDGSRYTSRLPTAVKDDSLAADLNAHHVTVKGVGTSPGLLGYMFWAAEAPSARHITTDPPNSCQNGIGGLLKAGGAQIPMPPLTRY